MYCTAPIKVVVEDNPNNPPELDSVATTFMLIVPRFCELPHIKREMMKNHPILQHLIAMIYYENMGK